MREKPSSPVDSPPHSPIIPMSNEDESTNDGKHGSPSRSTRRETSSPSLSTGNSSHLDSNRILVPVDVPLIENNNKEWVDYHTKFGDHYGINDPEWAEFPNKSTANGYRVPYGPLDTAKIPLKQGEDPVSVPHLREQEPLEVTFQGRTPQTGGHETTGRAFGVLAKPALDGSAVKLYREVAIEAYGIDFNNPPPIVTSFSSSRSHLESPGVEDGPGSPSAGAPVDNSSVRPTRQETVNNSTSI
jgi:hypothetical protein